MRFWNEGGAFFNGPVTASGNSTVNGDLGVNGAITINGGLTAQTLGLSGDMSAAMIYPSQGVLFGANKPKAYGYNGLINYDVFQGKDTLCIQGGGIQVADRQITLYAEGGCSVIGPVVVWGQNNLEFGGGMTKGTTVDGTIAYQKYSSGLDIVGAGSDPAYAGLRKITFHALAGSRFVGGVGIGLDPAYPLDVSGAASYTGGLPVSARFSQWIVCAAVMQVSDRRIKDVVGESDASRDMENLRKIRITDYRMKDRNPNDKRVIKGVIAQELRQALPDAVGEMPNIIPIAPIEAASIERAPGVAPIVAKFAAPHGIQKGDRIRLDLDGRTQDVNVTEVVDDRTLAFEGGIEVPKTVRVVGREVKDFLHVDYQQVYMTAVSALQEVDRRLQAVDQRVQEVEKREARMADLEKKAARVENLERDVAELRKLMAAIQSGAGKGATSASADGSSSGAVALSR